MKLILHQLLLATLAGFLLTGCGLSAPRPSLHSAVQKGDLQAVQKLIAAGTDLNSKNSAGWTPLHLAAMKGDLAMVEALCQAGADARRAGPQGKTPVDVARERKQVAIVQYLESKKEKRGRGLIDGGLGVSEAMEF